MKRFRRMAISDQERGCAMTRAEWVADRCDLLAEAAAIEADLAAREKRLGQDGGHRRISELGCNGCASRCSLNCRRRSSRSKAERPSVEMTEYRSGTPTQRSPHIEASGSDVSVPT